LLIGMILFVIFLFVPEKRSKKSVKYGLAVFVGYFAFRMI